MGVFGDWIKNQLIKISIKSKIKLRPLELRLRKISIDNNHNPTRKEKYYVGVFGDLEKNQLIKISIKSKVKVATIRIAIDKKINWHSHENITSDNIFVESESWNIFTVVICLPAGWEVSNNLVWMFSFPEE